MTRLPKEGTYCDHGARELRFTLIQHSLKRHLNSELHLPVAVLTYVPGAYGELLKSEYCAGLLVPPEELSVKLSRS